MAGFNFMMANLSSVRAFDTPFIYTVDDIMESSLGFDLVSAVAVFMAFAGALVMAFAVVVNMASAVAIIMASAVAIDMASAAVSFVDFY